MKFTKHIFAAVALLATLSACNYAEESITPSGEFEVQASASHGTDATRTALSADGTLSWINSDILGIYAGDIQANRAFTRTPAGNFAGSFARKGQADKSTTFYAYYPHSGSNQGYVVTANLSPNQEGTFNGQNDFMVADPVTALYSESKEMSDLNFHFDTDSHLFSIIHLQLADNNLKALAAEAVKSVTISSEGNVLSGTFTVDVRNPQNTVSFTEPHDYINISFGANQPLLNKPIDIWVVARPTNAGKPINLDIEILTSQGKATLSTTSPITLQRSKIKELPTIYVCDHWKKAQNVNDAFTDETLLEYMLGLADTNNDGQLITTEVENVSFVNINGLDVASLNGLELLQGLTSLYCTNIDATSIVLKNPKLRVLDISNNKLTKLDLSGCPALTSVTANNLKAPTLDLSGHTDIYDVSISNAEITTVDLSGLYNLNSFIYAGGVQNLSLAGCERFTSLNVVNFGLHSLDVSNCTSLVELDCYDNANLHTLKVKGCTMLQSIMTRQCAFTTLDLSGLSSLHTIYCQRNNLSSINLSGCTSLSNFYAHTNKWVELDFSSCSSISNINIKDTPTIKKIIIPADKNQSIINLENCGSPTIIKK